MATPSELSLEEIRNYLLENGGTARNHDLVKHFKRFLTDPESRGGSNCGAAGDPDARSRSRDAAPRRVLARHKHARDSRLRCSNAYDLSVTVEARNRFKEYVNTLATIKNEEVGYFRARRFPSAFRFDRGDLLLRRVCYARRRCRCSATRVARAVG